LEPGDGVPIPTREAFYSILTGSELSVKDYEDVLETCRVMGITDFREFHILYLQRAVYGLFDVVENFRSGYRTLWFGPCSLHRPPFSRVGRDAKVHRCGT
jgi:hypothetical protein